VAIAARHIARSDRSSARTLAAIALIAAGSAASHPKQELKDRIMVAMDYFNQAPVVHTWVYKLHRAA
jgi:hypothetical protein